VKYLGLDYGKTKIGLSVSEGLTATPLKVVTVRSLGEAVEKIRSEVRRELIDQLVIGVPESGEARNLVKNFIVRICKYVTVIEFEETLSSRNAFELMLQLGKGKKERAREDAYAATLILQNYLDSLDGEA